MLYDIGFFTKVVSKGIIKFAGIQGMLVYQLRYNWRETMRIRYKPWARPELEASYFYEDNPEKYIGNWKEKFLNKNNPIHLELGCGKGNFISQLAFKNRNINYIAIDLVDAMLGLAKRNIEKEYTNIKSTKRVGEKEDPEKMNYLQAEHFDNRNYSTIIKDYLIQNQLFINAFLLKGRLVSIPIRISMVLFLISGHLFFTALSITEDVIESQYGKEINYLGVHITFICS